MTNEADPEWDAAVAEFHALGGRAENICRKRGPFGFGLFVQDPQKPWALYAPTNLLFPVNDMAFENGVLRIKDSASVGPKEREFFERYEARFSWGAHGRDDAQAFMALMRGMPPRARDILIKDFRLLPSWFEDAPDSLIEDRFLDTRSIDYQGTRVLMPVLDLANYGEGCRFNTRDGISIEGNAADEILVRYSRADPFRVFVAWGFASAAETAFSLPGVFQGQGWQLAVLTRPKQVKLDEGVLLPIVTIEQRKITLSHLMLASRRTPRRPRNVFFRVLKETGIEKPELFFDRILQLNRLKFLDLLETVEDEPSESAAMLRKVIRHQLAALTYDWAGHA